MRTLEALGDLADKRVLVRVDFNVPLHSGASLELIEGKKLPGVEVLGGTDIGEPAAVAGAIG